MCRPSKQVARPAPNKFSLKNKSPGMHVLGLFLFYGHVQSITRSLHCCNDQRRDALRRVVTGSFWRLRNLGNIGHRGIGRNTRSSRQHFAIESVRTCFTGKCKLGHRGHPGFKHDIQDLPRLRQWRKKLWPQNRHRIEPLDGDCGDLYAALWPIASAQFDLNWHGG